MGKSFSKLNVKAQYCCSVKNFEQHLDDTSKIIFSTWQKLKDYKRICKASRYGRDKSIAVKILEKQQWRH